MLIERCFMRDSLNPFLFAMPIQSVNIIIIITRRAHIESKNSWNCIMNLIFADSVKPIYGTHTQHEIAGMNAFLLSCDKLVAFLNCKLQILSAWQRKTEPNQTMPNQTDDDEDDINNGMMHVIINKENEIKTLLSTFGLRFGCALHAFFCNFLFDEKCNWLRFVRWANVNMMTNSYTTTRPKSQKEN